MAFAGSPFEAEVVNERIEGRGKYTFPDGNVYIGEFKDGQFHGTGTIHFTHGGKYDASWDNGRAVEGTYTFHDGLTYTPTTWDYCTPPDRRFYSERVNGFLPGEPQLSNDVNGPREIPADTFDVGDGYYDPKDEVIRGYGGEVMRVPEEEEREWVVG
ncbi:uncharacterized protein EV422DRAFT_505850 [Fimicolochytrium jonesii]|uniref:uncharacterized protein n=1 Tax=Fimicolochytrium jonesii TaxID=1396493 RepID=UPI0022FEA66E|nr:uncharacterized protein EV422DRAFT_505850 [Fimicolochytrium jonesii]KAI8821752.1 hypothetical protein EV422DRAFT_505850 [Fimicolochytrium jonesii]